jgi:CRP-like cAMP-binding protein
MSSADGRAKVDNGQEFEEMPSGSWFGEACLFDESHVYESTIFALEESQMASLSRADFFQIVRRYPRLKDRYTELQRSFENGLRQVAELGYTASCSRPLLQVKRTCGTIVLA